MPVLHVVRKQTPVSPVAVVARAAICAAAAMSDADLPTLLICEPVCAAVLPSLLIAASVRLPVSVRRSRSREASPACVLSILMLRLAKSVMDRPAARGEAKPAGATSWRFPGAAGLQRPQIASGAKIPYLRIKSTFGLSLRHLGHECQIGTGQGLDFPARKRKP